MEFESEGKWNPGKPAAKAPSVPHVQAAESNLDSPRRQGPFPGWPPRLLMWWKVAYRPTLSRPGSSEESSTASSWATSLKEHRWAEPPAPKEPLGSYMLLLSWWSQHPHKISLTRLLALHLTSFPHIQCDHFMLAANLPKFCFTETF